MSRCLLMFFVAVVAGRVCAQETTGVRAAETRRFSLAGIVWPTGMDTAPVIRGSAPNQGAGDASPAALAKPSLGILEQWLEREIMSHCPGASKVWFEQAAVRAYSSTSDTQSVTTDVLVQGTEATFAAVDAVLRGLAAQKQVLVTVRERFRTRSIEQPPEGRPTVALLQKSQLAAQASGADVVSAPSLTLFQGQRSNVTIGNEVAFVTDFELQKARDQVIADPVITSLREGYQVDVRALSHPDGRSVSLWIEIVTASVSRPVEERDMMLGEQRVTVQLPEVTSNSWSSGLVDLRADEQGLRISGLSLLDSESHQLKSLEVFLDIVLGVPEAPGFARVITFDGQSKLIVAELTHEEQPRTGARLALMRGGVMFGEVVVERVEGKLLLGRYHGTEMPVNGDLVVPVAR